MDTMIIIGIAVHFVICLIVNACVAEKTNNKFCWMFFFGVPFGLIIGILLDISDAVYKPKVEKPITTTPRKTTRTSTKK